ncbi:transposase [Verminephrobacter eiseniae]|uniref:transposase n=1 Tax=Verminephrobacter eiseniae TaxID=364317 RepID=UPI0022376542
MVSNDPDFETKAADVIGLYNVRMHFTPTYSSWLNQVENWFSRIQRDVITCGGFTSVQDLGRKLMRYIREHNKNPKPIKWKYDDPSRRIRQGLIQ